MISVKVICTDGDYITTRMYATEVKAREYYEVGSWTNVGNGPYDLFKQVKSVEIIN